MPHSSACARRTIHIALNSQELQLLSRTTECNSPLSSQDIHSHHILVPKLVLGRKINVPIHSKFCVVHLDIQHCQHTSGVSTLASYSQICNWSVTILLVLKLISMPRNPEKHKNSQKFQPVPWDTPTHPHLICGVVWQLTRITLRLYHWEGVCKSETNLPFHLWCSTSA